MKLAKPLVPTIRHHLSPQKFGMNFVTVEEWDLLLFEFDHVASDDLTPPMYRMEPPLPDMQIGGIRISHSGGEAIGELIPYHSPRDHLFGARIDILGPIVYGCSLISVLKLSQQLLQTIQQTDDANFPYAIRIAEDLGGLFPSSLTQQ